MQWRNGTAAPAAETILRSRDRDALIVAILLPLTTFSILCYEIALTRLFSYIFTYHLTAIAVSVALFGLGSGAYVRVRWLSRLPQGSLAVVAHLASNLSLLALYTVLLFTHDPTVVIFVSAMPFAFAGVAVSYYYEARRSGRAAATYALDLSGAAAACVAGVFLVVAVGVDGALLFLSGLAGAAAVLASMRASGNALGGKGLLLAGFCAVLPEAAYFSRSHWPDPLLNRHSSPEKLLPRLLGEHGRVVDTAWSPVGRADVYESPSEPDIKWILTDATNSTPLVRQSDDADRPEWSRQFFASLPYAVAPVRTALILGSGAGLEVRLARAAGVAEVEAVELNAAIIRLVRRWRGFGGPVYDRPGVALFVEEARQFVLTRPRRYDLIQLSLVLTGTAQTGTYALAERYLYTLEAFGSYLDHLEPAGSLAIIDDSLQRTLKNTVTVMAVFEQTLGLRSEEAMKRVAVLFNRREWESGYKFMLVVSPSPLSEARIRRLNEEVARRDLVALWLPGVATHPEFEQLARMGTRAFVRTAPINLEPPTDDRPYLNNFARAPADVLRLLRPYLIFSALIFAALAAMFATGGIDSGAAGRRATALAGLYGVGFMFLELGLLHKLTLAVGPTSVLSVVLFALLLYCGLGSLVFGRFALFLRSRLGSFAIVVGIAGVATSEVIERWYRLEGVSSSALRAACVLAIVAPIGFSLGAPFPDLLRRYGRSDDRRLAYLWAVNGVGSVLGGGLTVVLSLVLGGRAVLLAGSVLYLLAWVIDRPSDPSETEARPSPENSREEKRRRIPSPPGRRR